MRDFILRNYTPYEGDASFLAGPTTKTLDVWDTLEKEYLSVERAKRAYRAAARSVRSKTIFVPSSRFSTEIRSSMPWYPFMSSPVNMPGTSP